MYSVAVDFTAFRSPNYSQRKLAIDSIIIHHTGGLMPGCAKWLCMEESKVSAHLLINKQGEIYQLVDNINKAWHAGRGAFDVDKDGNISPVEKIWNDRSIGIELEAIEPYKYLPHQLHSLERLCYDLCFEYHIKSDYILGHKEIAPGRKIDPANFDMFDWRKIIQNLIDD